MKTETKMIYRSIGQTPDGLTITAEAKKPTTADEARKDAEKHVFQSKFTLTPFIVLPIATESDWKSGYINFCPRCGRRVEHLESSGTEFDCHECNATCEVYIQIPDMEDGEDE